MLFRLLEKRKANLPMLVTGLPSIVSGMISWPAVASSHPFPAVALAFST